MIHYTFVRSLYTFYPSICFVISQIDMKSKDWLTAHQYVLLFPVIIDDMVISQLLAVIGISCSGNIVINDLAK